MDQKFLLLATRVLTREASPAEGKRLNALLADPQHRAGFERLRQCWEAAAPEPAGGFDAKDAARRIGAAIRATKPSVERSRATTARQRRPQ